jgi:hypothetical protein
MSDVLVKYLERNLSNDDTDIEEEIYCIYRELTSNRSGIIHPMDRPIEGAYWCFVSSVVYHWCSTNGIPLTWELSDLHDAVHNWNNKTNRFGHTSLNNNRVIEFGITWARKIDQLSSI